jgi:hypothetical protein
MSNNEHKELVAHFQGKIHRENNHPARKNNKENESLTDE